MAIGVVFGFITNALIFPAVLETNQIGLISILVSYATLFSQFGTLGFVKVINRMFPYFRDRKHNHHGFLFITIIISVLGFLLTTLVFLLFKPYLVEKSIENSPLFVEYVYTIIPLT